MAARERERRAVGSEPPGSRDAAAIPDFAVDQSSQLLGLVPDAAIMVDAAGTITAANLATSDLFGYQPDELVGQAVETLLPERFRHGHRRLRGAFLEDPRARTMGQGLSLRARRRDASELPVDVSLAPVTLGGAAFVVAAIRDLTDRETAMRERTQLASIVSSSHDAIIAITPEGTVTSWNPGAEAMLGFRAEEVTGSHLSVVLAGPATEVVEELLGAVMAGEHPPVTDTVWVAQHGASVEVAISLSPVTDDRGELEGFALLVRDATARKRAERAQQRAEEIQAATIHVRMATLDDAPPENVIALVCRFARELTGAASALLSLPAGPLGPTLVTEGPVPAGAPASVPQWADLATAAADMAAVQSLGPADAPSVVVAPTPLGAGASGVLLVAAGDGRHLAQDAQDAAASLGVEVALILEIYAARASRRRVLLADDRERIARDLHDLVIQRLFAAGLGLQSTVPLIDNESAAARVAQTVDDLDATIREIRSAIFALERPPSGRNVGARDRILTVVEEMEDALGFRPSIEFAGTVEDVSERLQAQLEIVLREALSNVARHADATTASIRLAAADDVVLTVADNGSGLPRDRRESGLQNLRARAEEHGGIFATEAVPSGGTRLVWSAPLRQRDPAGGAPRSSS